MIRQVRVKIGDTVSRGSVIALLESEGAASAAPPPAALPAVAAPPAPVSAPGGVAEVRVPDIGDFKDVPVIEIHVQPGATVKPEDSLVTLESDKATMDVPSPLSGTVSALRVAVGDRVSEGSVLLLLATGTAGPVGAGAASAARSVSAPAMAPTGVSMAAASPVDEAGFVLAYAGPAVRRLARELRVDLGNVKGSGDKGRIVRADVEAFARSDAPAAAPAKAAPPSGGGAGLDLLPWPKVDFAKFGQSASQLGDDSARHQSRRSRHHRPGGIPGAVEQRE